MRRFAWILSAGLLAGTASGAHAEAAQAEDPPGADAGGSNDIIVTAQRREERLQDVPLTITALSDDQLAKSGVTSIVDLQSVVSGLSFSGNSNSLRASIRGVSTQVTTNGSENPNALYVDGVYFSQFQLLGANLPDVARVEVLKGPQGTLFGRNSVSGAIRIFTKEPSFARHADLHVDVGAYTGSGSSRSSSHVAARGFVNLPLVDEKVAVSLSGAHEWVDGYLQNDATGQAYGRIRRDNARAKLLLQPSDAVKAVLTAFYLDHDDEGLQASTPLNGMVVANAYPGSVVPSLPYHTSFDSGNGKDFNLATVRLYGFSGNLQVELGEIGMLSSITAYNKNRVVNEVTLNHSRVARQCQTAFACIDYAVYIDNKEFSEELNFSSNKFGILSFTAGLYYFNRTYSQLSVAQATVIPGGSVAQDVTFKIHSYAAYGEALIEPNDRLSIILGGRYTHEPRDDTIFRPTLINRKDTFNSFIPRVSVKYDVSPALNVYATFAKGEKSGMSGVANTASIPPFATVEPESNTSYEIGLKYAAGGFSFNLAGFYYDYKNKQEQAFTGTSQIIQNTGKVRIYGLDADASVNLGDFDIRANASWVPEAKYLDFPNAVAATLNRTANGQYAVAPIDMTGERLVYAPELTANLSVSYAHRIDHGTFDANATVSYSSEVFHDLAHIIRQAPYATLNAQAGYAFDGGLRIGIYGRNLTDKAFIANGFSSSQGFTVGYNRPREVGLSLSYSY
jgi:iron complex outermembrane receptor protein